MRQRWRYFVVLMAGVACAMMILLKVGLGAEEGTSPGKNDVGESVYNERCAPCHGRAGKGDGPNAFFLTPRPRDFTTGSFKIRSTESGSIPTDEDLTRAITQGLPATAMPAWGKFLRGDTLQAIVAYVKSFSPRFLSEKPKRVPMPGTWSSSPASIEAGKRVYAELQCGSCHGVDGAGGGGSLNDFEDDRGDKLKAANLTQPWTFKGGPTAQDIYLRFRTGLDGTPMPTFVGSASDKEMHDLANYVASLGRKPVWQMSGPEVEALYGNMQRRNASDPVQYGEYLVSSYGCVHCHSPIDENGEHISGMKFAGGQKWELGAYGTFVSYNLTSDSATGLGRWTDDQIKAVLTKGVRRDGSRMLPFPMPWTTLATLSSSDLDAMVAYLRTIPPVQNKIPDPKPLGFFSYLSEKFRMLILKKELVVHVYGGNAGSTGSEVKP